MSIVRLVVRSGCVKWPWISMKETVKESADDSEEGCPKTEVYAAM